MITEGLLRAFVHQASESGCGDNPFTASLPTALNSAVSAGRLRTSQCSPLDCPDLLLSFHAASRDALLHHHSDIPMLQPRATYAMPSRLSPAAVGRSRTRHTPYHLPPPYHSRGSAASAASGRSSQSAGAPSLSPPYARPSRDEAPSPSAEVYRATGGRLSGLRGPSVMTGRPTRGWQDDGGGDGDGDDEGEEDEDAWGFQRHHESFDSDMIADGRPSWTPLPPRIRRPTTRRSVSRSVAPFDPLAGAEEAEGMDDVESFGVARSESFGMARTSSRGTGSREDDAPPPRGSMLYLRQHHHFFHHRHHHHHHHPHHHHHLHYGHHLVQQQRPSHRSGSSGPLGRGDEKEEAQVIDVDECNDDDSSGSTLQTDLQATMPPRRRGRN